MNFIPTIRLATEKDAEELLAIYKPYVLNTAISFEYEVPTVAEFSTRISMVLRKYPFIVAVLNEEIVGYAYANVFHDRTAYDRSVETSIYVKDGKRGAGIGHALYSALEKLLAAQGILNMNACIAFAAENDPYLTNDSTYFHTGLGFSQVGRFHKCGYKFSRWYDMIWMEKLIGEHLDNPNPVRSIGELDNNTLKSCGLTVN